MERRGRLGRTHLHALPLLTGEGGLHHAVVLPQGPGLVDELDVVDPRGGDAVRPQGVLAGKLGATFGVVDVEDHVAFAYVEVPGDDGGGVNDLDQHLEEEVGRYRGGGGALKLTW